MAKPSSLEGIMAKKGEAQPPADQPQRAAAQPDPIEDVEEHDAPAPKTPTIAGATKSLTVKIPDSVYRQLRLYALEANRTHQDIVATLIKNFVKRNSRPA